jgi:hypothetical protein
MAMVLSPTLRRRTSFAIGAINALYETVFPVPGDVSVAGFDDSDCIIDHELIVRESTLSVAGGR